MGTTTANAATLNAEMINLPATEGSSRSSSATKLAGWSCTRAERSFYVPFSFILASPPSNPHFQMCKIFGTLPATCRWFTA